MPSWSKTNVAPKIERYGNTGWLFECPECFWYICVEEREDDPQKAYENLKVRVDDHIATEHIKETTK